MRPRPIFDGGGEWDTFGIGRKNGFRLAPLHFSGRFQRHSISFSIFPEPEVSYKRVRTVFSELAFVMTPERNPGVPARRKSRGEPRHPLF